MKSQDAFRLNVKALMDRQGLRVKDLADMVGLSPSYLSLVLSGDRANLSDRHKDAIALALGTTVAELYRPTQAGAAGAAETVLRPESEGRAEPAFLLRRKRDISPFEDLLRALNVADHLLLEAFYRELNSLSDDEVRSIGGMLRRALSSWREASERESSRQRQAAPGQVAPPGLGPFHGGVMGPNERAFLWLVLYLSSLFGDVPLSFIGTAASWPQQKIHQTLETLVSSGAVQILPSGGSGGGGTGVMVRPCADVSLESASHWIPLADKRQMLLSLAADLDKREEAPLGGGTSAVRPDQLAQLYLEAGELPKARGWYEQAAVREFSAGMWRLAKEHLLVVSSLDNILGTSASDRVPVIQMLATACFNLGETDEALVYQERNIAYWEKSGPPSDLVRGLLMASSIYARRREWGKAQERLDRALSVSHGDYALEARVRLGLAAVLAERGYLTRCRDECELAMDLGGRAQEQSLVAEAALGLGRVFLWRRDFRRAGQYLNRALSLAENKEAALEVLTRIEMGKLRFDEGSFAIAQEHLDKAVRAAAVIGDPAAENAAKALLSRCIGRGSLEADLELKRSLAYSAREFFRGVDDKRGLVWALLACAEAEAALGRPAEAEALFQESAREGRGTDNPVLEAEACEAYASYLMEHDDVLAQVMSERARWARAKVK